MSAETPPARHSWAPRLEVTSWPFDQRARHRLTQFRQERMRNLDVIFWGADLDLRGAHLCGFDFSRASFNGAVLDKVHMLGANLSGVALSGSSLEHADLTGCVLVKADLSYCRGRGAILAWVRLSRAEIYDADLREADLIGAELDGASLAGSDLRGARLEGVRFSRTSLGRARLADCLLTGARGSVLGPVDVSKTDEPELVDGEDLLGWFRDRKAPHVTLSRRGALWAASPRRRRSPCRWHGLDGSRRALHLAPVCVRMLRFACHDPVWCAKLVDVRKRLSGGLPQGLIISGGAPV